MKKGKHLRGTRIFSESFKRSRVKEYETGQFTVLELSRIFQISDKTLYNWIYKYSAYNKKQVVVVEEKKSATGKLKAYEKRIEELERIVGQKQIMIDYLEKMIELAKSEYDIDLKKNSNTPPSSGSGKTESK